MDNQRDGFAQQQQAALDIKWCPQCQTNYMGSHLCGRGLGLSNGGGLFTVDKLAAVRELRALGALRITFPGLLEVTFAPLVAPDTLPAGDAGEQPAREQTEDEVLAQYAADALASSGS